MTNYISGVRSLWRSGDATNIISTRQIRQVENEIALLDRDNTALTTLLMKMRNRPWKAVKVEWYEDVFPAQATTVATAPTTTTDTTFDVASGTGKYGRAGDLWLHSPTGEVVYIVSVSDDTWTVVRAVGDENSPSSWSNGDQLFYIGNAQMDGDSARPSLTTQTVQKYNYMQLFKEAYEVDNTANSVQLYGGPDLTYLRQKHGELHKRDIERACWFGEMDRLDSGDNANITVARTMEGFFNFISTNVHVDTGPTTEDDIDTYLRQDFRYGNNVKFLFASPLACSVIDSWGRGKLQVVPRDTTYGIRVTRYISSHGELNIINNKLFYDMDDSNSGAAYNYGASAAVVDIEDLGYFTLRATTLEQNIQDPDEDTVEEQYLTQCTIKVANEKHHAAIMNWSLS